MPFSVTDPLVPTSFSRSSTCGFLGSPPCGTMVIVPSAAIDRLSCGGTVIGPAWPWTMKPSPVWSTPDAATSRSPRRV